MLLIIFLTAFILGPFVSAAPGAPGCTFIPRRDAKELMRDHTNEVVGWVSCFEKNPHLGTFTVARFHSLTDKPVNEFLYHLARQLSPDALNTVIVGENKEKAGHRQLMLRSQRNNGKFAWHYVFTGRGPDGKLYVFIHSGNQEDTLSNELSLREVRSQLTKPGFLSKLGPPEESNP